MPVSANIIKHENGFTINGSTFHVDNKYNPIDVIGKGSYGIVCSAENIKTKEKVAIKKINPMAGDEWDATHTLREIRLMRCLGEHENIISLKDLSMSEEKDELYMMMELIDTDLHRLIQSSTKLSKSHIRVIMYQLLSGVKAMHENEILHRDLKPGNLLINKDCELKITDFGLARMIPKDISEKKTAKIISPMTEYVVTRWYRPPELMLAPNGCYNGAVDMWSVGCILAELFNRRPIFPGSDFMDQLMKVFKIVTIPSKNERSYKIEKDALNFLESLPPAPSDAFEKNFKTACDDGLDLIKKLLKFNPSERISAADALQHPFLKDVQKEWGTIPDIKASQPQIAFTFENKSLPLATLKQYIRDEVKSFSKKSENTVLKTVPSTKQEEPAMDINNIEGKKQDQNNTTIETNNNNYKAGIGFSVNKCFFNVDPRYEPVGVLGEGTYGIVCCALDKTTNKKVAIKKITPMAGDEWDARHTLREVRLMRYFGSHPNITGLKNLSTCLEKDELYLMMEMADTDLHRLIQSKTVLTSRHIEAIMYQILCGVQALHANGVLHRDLKPGNLLVGRNCDVKIADFGLSRVALQSDNMKKTVNNKEESRKNNVMTEYVVTRWYRSPEIMLTPNGEYTSAVDMWSIGCIFGELLNREPLFPGNDYIDQLVKVFAVVPVPKSNEKRGYDVEGDALTFLNSLSPCSQTALEKKCPSGSSDAINLLKKLLCINPLKRISAESALQHPYFKQVRKDLKTPAPFTVHPVFNLDFDSQNLPLDKLKDLILQEVYSIGASEKAILKTNVDSNIVNNQEPNTISTARNSINQEKVASKSAQESVPETELDSIKDNLKNNIENAKSNESDRKLTAEKSLHSTEVMKTDINEGKDSLRNSESINKTKSEDEKIEKEIKDKKMNEFVRSYSNNDENNKKKIQEISDALTSLKVEQPELSNCIPTQTNNNSTLISSVSDDDIIIESEIVLEKATNLLSKYYNTARQSRSIVDTTNYHGLKTGKSSMNESHIKSNQEQ